MPQEEITQGQVTVAGPTEVSPVLEISQSIGALVGSLAVTMVVLGHLVCTMNEAVVGPAEIVERGKK